MAKILHVNYIHFIGVTPGCVEDIMLTFLWLDENDRSTIHLFLLIRNSDKCNASDGKSVRYYDNNEWPTHSPVDMWLEYGLVNDLMRKEQLKMGGFPRTNTLSGKLIGPLRAVRLISMGKMIKNVAFNGVNI